MKAAGVLTRLSLAWSRDGSRKFYVQDRMREVGRELWAWLADGAHFYVCGDASAWPRTSSAPWSTSSRPTARAAPRGGRLRRRAQEERALPQDVY